MWCKLACVSPFAGMRIAMFSRKSHLVISASQEELTHGQFNKLNSEAGCDLYYVACVKLVHTHTC
jgi:hypothetical protein